MTIHHLIDWEYGPDGDNVLRERLKNGVDPNEASGPLKETPLHVAARRYRCSTIEILLDHGANIDAKTAGGKTAYAHAIRRGFRDLAELLARRGAETALNEADQLAVAFSTGDLQKAGKLLANHPEIAKTGNPEEDRLFADIAGRNASEPVKMLIAAGADLTATGLDSGTPLHQAAWFGQPQNARLLIAAGATLEVFDATHQSSPLGWAVHGSRYSGGANDRQDLYVELVGLFLDAGASLQYPGQPESDAYLKRLLKDASPRVHEVLKDRAK